MYIFLSFTTLLPDVSECPGIVVVAVPGDVALVPGFGAGVVVDPLLPPGAVRHDGPELAWSDYGGEYFAK